MGTFVRKYLTFKDRIKINGALKHQYIWCILYQYIWIGCIWKYILVCHACKALKYSSWVIWSISLTVTEVESQVYTSLNDKNVADLFKFLWLTFTKKRKTGVELSFLDLWMIVVKAFNVFNLCWLFWFHLWKLLWILNNFLIF